MKDRAEFIQQVFRELGLSLNPSSRLGKQIDFYLDRKGTLPQFIEPHHPLHKIGVEAFRDLNQIAFALGHLLPVIPGKDMERILGRINQDNVLPQESPTQSPGRDAQLELFAAGLCACGGLAPVFDESPDIRCTRANINFGVAVKRIKAAPESFERRFEERVRDAAKQITRAKMPGIIVVDISQSLNPDNWWVPIEWDDAKFNAEWEMSKQQFKCRFEPRLPEWTRGTEVRGVIVLDHILRCTPAKRWEVQLFGLSFHLTSYNKRRLREFVLFDSQFMHAVMNPTVGPAFSPPIVATR